MKTMLRLVGDAAALAAASGMVWWVLEGSLVQVELVACTLGIGLAVILEIELGRLESPQREVHE